MSWTHGYREYLPAADLRQRVDCFWVANAPRESPPGDTKCVLPDGCADFLFDLQALAAKAAGSRCIGAMTRPLAAASRAGQRLFGIRFRPGGLRDLLPLPMKELRNEHADLQDLSIDSDHLVDRLLEAGDEPSMCSLAQDWLRGMNSPPGDALIRVAVQRVESATGELSIGELAAELGVSRQHLARRFSDQVGLSPKELQRILRMQSSLDLLRREARPSLAEIAMLSGYCDQAHMNLEFRVLTGSSPGEMSG